MEVSVEQYLGIGSHGNFLKTKDAFSCFKDSLWNIILMHS